MSTNWRGYLLRAKKDEHSSWETFPMKYINEASWESTPNQREELKAYRNENNRDLTRVTASGKKSSITFKTRPNLHLTDKIKVQKFFTDNENNASQRRIYLEYWNDESNDYKKADFYRTDTKFTIKKVTEDDIIYDELQIELVEY